jgi:hypothetical protein
MPLDSTVDHERRRVHVKGTDPITTTTVLESLEHQAAIGAWRYAALVDLSEATWIPAAAELRQFLGQIQRLSKQHGVRGPVAFAVAGNGALFGMIRMYGILAEMETSNPIKVEVFPTAAEAAAWLDAL